MASENRQQVESEQSDTEMGAPPFLICARCGGGFSMWLWQPRLRCPHCRTLGYPDRAIHNLLPLSWDCPACGAENAVTTNFCVACGTGLASRCLRCERPVYTAICLHCGAHQAAMFQYQIAQARRVIWEPIVRARIQEQQIEEQAAQASPPPPPISSEPEAIPAKSASPAQPKRHQHSRAQLVGGLALIVLGFYLLNISFPEMLPGIVSNISLPVWMNGILSRIQTWWAAWAPTLHELETLSPDDRRYLGIFATVVLGLASLPLSFYFIERLARRLFP